MPCSEANQQIEKQQAGFEMPLLQRQRLNAHLFVCKWCTNYKKKVRVLDSALNTLIGKEIDIKDEGADMQDFKELLKNKFKK